MVINRTVSIHSIEPQIRIMAQRLQISIPHQTGTSLIVVCFFPEMCLNLIDLFFVYVAILPGSMNFQQHSQEVGCIETIR